MARQTTPNILDDLMSSQPAGVVKPAPTLVALAAIRSDGGTQMRAGLDPNTISEYMQALQDADHAWPFPPVVLYHDGETYWLADGFHRVAAARQLERAEAVPADVRAGDRRMAVLYAAGANADHGLRRTNADKRRSVEVLLRDQEWEAWSDREIARICRVTHPFVALMRKELSGNGYQMQAERTVNRGGQTYTQNTAGQREAAQRRQQRDDAAEDAWQPAQETPRYQPPVVGRPMMEVLKTADELAAEAEAADIASRNAAADEAIRQAQAADPERRVCMQCGCQFPAGNCPQCGSESFQWAHSADEAMQLSSAARRLRLEPPAAATNAQPRHAHLLHVLEQAMEALPEIGDAIGQPSYCRSVVTTLAIMQKELLRVAADAKKAPAPPPAAPATELPADLVAHGWELRQTRAGGMWLAAITPADEEQEITTVKRGKIDDVIGDCRFMERSLKIGAPA